MTPRICLFTASDTRFMPLLKSMICSFQPFLREFRADLACFDLGLSQHDLDWLQLRRVIMLKPRLHLDVANGVHNPTLLSFLARPFLREYLPGYDVYLWADSDIWLQDPSVASLYVETALRQGMAITHEKEPSYRFQAWLFGWTAKHMLLGYDPLTALNLLRKLHLNAGFFAISAVAPHWELWARRYRAAIQRSGALVPHDQFALNHAIHGNLFGRSKGLDTGLLPPSCNWICDRGIPMWNDTAQVFCRPVAPFEPIRAMHLAGPAKYNAYDVQRTSGGSFRTFLVSGATPATPQLAGPLCPSF